MRVKIANAEYWGNGVYVFKCPGCGDPHYIYTDPANPMPNKEKSVWGFNGNTDRPTFSPSILYHIGKYVPGLTPEQIKYCQENEKQGMKGFICHSFVEDGKIRILSDSHNHPGETLDLEEIFN